MVPHTQPACGADQSNTTDHLDAVEELQHGALGVGTAAIHGDRAVVPDTAGRDAQGAAGGTGRGRQGRVAAARQLRAAGPRVREETFRECRRRV